MSIGCNLFDEEAKKGALVKVGITVDEYEHFMELKSIEEKLGVDLVEFLTEFAHVMKHHSETVGLTTDGTKIVLDYGYIEEFVNELKACVSKKKSIEQKKIVILSNNAETLTFLYTGAEGTYLLDRIAFKDKFDEDDNNDWGKSTGKKKLQEWAENNLPKKILKKFDVDLPTVEEVFSQKMFGWRGEPANKLTSKQFPLFQNSDNRMMEFEGSHIDTGWWTRSDYAGRSEFVWYVTSAGSMTSDHANHSEGFVPVLRKRKE